MIRRRRDHSLLLTDRAVADMAEINAYSMSKWGEATAFKYISDIDAGLERIRRNPDLLIHVPEYHSALRFYRIRQHMLVCDVRDETIYVFAVIHTAMNIHDRLADLEPTFAREVEILHRRLWRS